MVKHHQCQIFRQNTIVFPKIVKRFKRDINAVSNGIQLDIDGQNESENFSLYLKKNANLGYFYYISSRLKPTTKHHVCFVHLIFGFWSYYVNFVYILQSKMGKTEKNGKKITQLKVSRSQNKIVEQKTSPKKERTDSFFYRDSPEILDT